MSTGTLIFAYCALGTFITMILFVLFGQITVRKLRKNPNTKDALGGEFIGGWDILNVATALSLPRFVMQKMENSQISYMYANSAVLIENTNKFDRALACVFYWSFMLTGLSLLLFVPLDLFGVFGE